MTPLPQELTERLLAFRAERDWQQFHNPRSLAAALAVEAGELLELFMWARDGEVEATLERRRADVEDELADIAVMLTYLCQDLKVDLAAAVARKLPRNAEKYPVDKARGRSEKYSRL